MLLADRVNALLLAILALGASYLALHSWIQLDEFTYTHAAWLISQGSIPYKDFALIHPPLFPQLLSFIVQFNSTDPNVIFCCRMGMVGVVVLLFSAMLRTNSSTVNELNLWKPALLVTIAPIVSHLIEIRPDTLAFCFFLSSMLLYLETRFAILAGITLSCAFWTSEKSWIYSLPLLALSILDARDPSRRKQSTALLVGLLPLTLGEVAYFYFNDGFSDLVLWVLGWGLIHEQLYPKDNSFGLDPNFWLLTCALTVLSLVGLYHSIRRDTAKRKLWLLWATLALSLASFLAQRAPYYYSLIPALCLLALLSARAFVLPGNVPGGLRQKRIYLGAILIVALAIFSAFWPKKLPVPPDNGPQRRMLNAVHRLTSSSDCVYDNTGQAITRRDAHPVFFTDKLFRMLMAEMLTVDLRQMLVQKQCVAFLPDERIPAFPRHFLQWLEEHYIHYRDRVWLWGKKLPRQVAGESTFLALKDGIYLLENFPQSKADGEIVIDNIQVSSNRVLLHAGKHHIRFESLRQTVCLRLIAADGSEPEPGHCHEN